MESSIVPVILAGGTGSRLWPLSRSSHPKQVLKIIGENTLLQDTLLRSKEVLENPPIVICNHEYRFLVAEQIRQIDIHSAKIIIEPIAKNTAPAITLAALSLLQEGLDPLLFVMPADHFMQFEAEQDFHSMLSVGSSLALQNYLVTFGILPTASKTGYGYIKIGKALLDDKAYYVEEFVEKPNQKRADQYFKNKKHLWNSGMFLFRASKYLAELKKYAANIHEICSLGYSKRKEDLDFIYVPSEDFEDCPSNSIDYAIMEHTDDAAIVPIKATWSDIGIWSSIFDLEEKDENGNVIQGDIIAEKSKNCYLRSTHRLIATIGVEDHIVIETPDSVLVAHKNECQNIKAIVEKLLENNRVEASLHHFVHRPWGGYEVLVDAQRYKVKRLNVKMGASLSLQKHQHRSEHWIVVKGVASIINGDEKILLYPSQSTYIPQGAKHRLSNYSDQLLEIIEVQIGDYLGEDDIHRFDDEYGRSEELLLTLPL